MRFLELAVIGWGDLLITFPTFPPFANTLHYTMLILTSSRYYDYATHHAYPFLIIGGEPYESGFDSNGDPIPVFYSAHDTPVEKEPHSGGRLTALMECVALLGDGQQKCGPY